MKTLFVIKSLSHFAYVSSIISKDDVVLFDKTGSSNAFRSSKRAVKYAIDKIEWSQQRRRFRYWVFLIREIRTYVSYIGRNQSDYYRKRWLKYLPFWIRPFVWDKKWPDKWFEKIESRIRPCDSVVKDLIKRCPKCVAVTPGNHRFSEEIEYIKAAKFLGIPTRVIILSWDNLTTKGLFHVKPDKFLVWNYSQVHELAEIHGVSRTRCKIIGSPLFKKWIRNPENGKSRKPKNGLLFRNQAGLNLFSKFVLYLGSSSNIAPDETWLIERVRRWLPKNIQLLVRPHPANWRKYQSIKNVTVYPIRGQLPESELDENDFYSAIYHCVFAFGVNTSAMIDVVANDKSCVTLLTDEYKSTQADTAHFKQLKDALYVCKNNDELLKTFSILLSGRDTKSSNRKQWVSNYL